MAKNGFWTRVMGRELDYSRISLSELPVLKFDEAAARRVQEKRVKENAEYKAKYGFRWRHKLAQDILERNRIIGEDMAAREINTFVYGGTYYNVEHGILPQEKVDKVFARMRELYGDRYDELKDHGPWDPRVADLLLADAMRTGRRNQLPMDLWDEYDRRIGGCLS